MVNKEKQTFPGIPANLTLDYAKEWVRPRISEKRFRHTEGVVETARELAVRSNGDEFLAQLGAWLHDCCKEIKDKELIKRAKDFGLKLHPVEEYNGHLLHGPVAAETVKAELGLTNQEVLDAIAEHTLGAVNMTVLSKILFLADALEPGRSPEYCKNIWQALHPCVWPEKTEKSEELEELDAKKAARPGHRAGQPILYGLEALKLTSRLAPDLDQAIVVACDVGLADLIECKRVIHPKTVKVRNYYLQIVKERQA